MSFLRRSSIITPMGSKLGENETIENENQEGEENDKEEVSKIDSEISLSSTENFELESEPILSENSTIIPKAIEFCHSFGYDCQKLYNLCLIDSSTLVFGSGNIIHFYNIKTRNIVTRRTIRGGGIGFITKNPNPEYNYLTIAENGVFPPIIIYKYPEMEVISVLKKGTKKIYSCVAYSPDGTLLAAQGGEPDYMLTIWDWKNIKIILRSQSYSNDILTVIFSPFVEGQLATSGLAHIKFWKMCKTFTGLKLQGNLGRFGKTEISDILGIFPMPDEKVISGCSWGNVLVWDEGLIKYEVCRKSRKQMHAKMITQLEMNNDEVMTAGLDGYIRIWFWSTVELADPPDDDPFVEIEPIYEYKIGSKNHLCEIIYMVKKENNPNDYHWYIQDGNGGIWLADISPDYSPKPSVQLFRCHAGPIIGLGASAFSPHIATLGVDGRLYVYDYEQQILLYYKQFPALGTALLWIPITIEPTGVVLALGFDDGVIRMVALDLIDYESNSEPISLIQVMKSHTKMITKLSINPTLTILVSGSEDSTIFIYKLIQEDPFVRLAPIGFIETPSPCTAINWALQYFTRILVGCLYGEVIEADLPERERSYTTISFHLHHIDIRKLVFKSVKSEILRERYLEEVAKRKENRRLEKMEMLAKLRRDNPGIQVDENTFLEDSENDDVLPPLIYPKIPNRVLWLQYTSSNTIWISMSGYDAGYIYEYSFDHDGPVQCTLIPEAGDLEIHSYYYIDKYLIFGMQNGVIRINAIKEDFRDLSDYFLLTMHDNLNGIIPTLEFSYNKKYLFSIGSDGNLFSYKWNIPTEPVELIESLEPNEFDIVKDIENKECLSLEQQKRKEDLDHRQQIAEEKKEKVLDILINYKAEFQIIQKLNQNIPKSQRLTSHELELDPRVSADLQETLNDQMNLIKRKLEFDVEKSKLAEKKLKEFYIDTLESYPIEVQGIEVNTSVRTFRIQKLSEEFQLSKLDLEERIRIDAENRRKSSEESNISERAISLIEDHQIKEEEFKDRKLESFLQGLSASTIEYRLESKMRRLLKKYRDRKDNEQRKKLEWEYTNSIKPDINVNHPDDVKAIEEAEKTIGDYKLKIDQTIVFDESVSDTALKKFKELLSVREEIFTLRNTFNQKVLKMRAEKMDLLNYYKQETLKLFEIHLELPKSDRQLPIHFPDTDVSVEFPETLIEVRNRRARVLSNLRISRLSTLPKLYDSSISCDKIQRDIIGLREFVNDIESTENILNEYIPDLTIKLDQPSSKGYNRATVQTSLWEKEQRHLRLTAKLYEQTRIISELNRLITEFDQKLIQLKDARLECNVHAKFLDIYLLTVNQELWILKDFEKLEEKLIEKLAKQVTVRNQIQTKIVEHKNIIESCRKTIEKLMEEEKMIQSNFIAKCSNNKFFDFLRRIFKKKFKIQRIFDPDVSESSSESSESSTDEEAENKSIDSLDIGPIRMDENICPPGCDKVLFDLTFELRSERHVVEQNVKDQYRDIENNKKEIDELNKSIKKVELVIREFQDEVDKFKKDKQQVLNQVETLAILKMDQLQHFEDNDELHDIENTLLFNNNNLSQLYARVEQLEGETLEARRQHRVNVVHLTRMKTDCRLMEQQIVELKEDIHQAMLRKFGIIVSLDELEEAILSRMVYEMKANVDDIKREYDFKMMEEDKKITKLQTEYNRVIQEGTEKLNILTVLQEEKNYLDEVQANLQRLEIKNKIVHIDYSRDVNKLKDISRQQKEQINVLQREIRTLSLKSKPFDPVINQDSMFEPIPEPKIGDSEQDYQESIYSPALGSMHSIISQPGSSRDDEILHDTVKIIDKFLTKVFHKTMDIKEVQRKSYNLAKYVTKIPFNFNDKSSDTESKLFQNFYSYLTKSLQHKINENEVRNIFTEIVNVVKDIEIINPNEILMCIIDSTKDLQISKSQAKFSQDFLYEIITQMILLMKISDLNNSELLDTLISQIMLIKEFNTKSLNNSKLISNIMSYVNLNYIDDVEKPLITWIINYITSNLQKIYVKMSNG